MSKTTIQQKRKMWAWCLAWAATDFLTFVALLDKERFGELLVAVNHRKGVEEFLAAATKA